MTRLRLHIGMALKSGPWGGGNSAIGLVSEYLAERGARVAHDLREPGADAILLTDPRKELESCAFDHRSIVRYLVRNPRTLVVHRINECDERKGTQGLNALLIDANRCADHTVFVAEWLERLFREQGITCPSMSVIRNGSDRRLYHPNGRVPWDGSGPLKLVTHHWGGHWMKGFDVYQRLDELLDKDGYRDEIDFTYIGNLPAGFTFQNAKYRPPLYGQELADELRSHHVYLTASRNEPGGNHQNEGGNCGLPLLYLDSGCFPEYCAGYGIAFTPETFETKLREMMSTYATWVPRMIDFPNTALRMCEGYEALFRDLVVRRDEFLARRRLWKQPLWALRTWVGA